MVTASETMPRYNISITRRQETEILDECRRRQIGVSEMARRIFDSWVERRIEGREKQS